MCVCVYMLNVVNVAHDIVHVSKIMRMHEFKM